MFRFLAFVGLLTLTVPPLGAQTIAARAPAPVAFVHVTVIAMNGEAPAPDQTVVTDGRHIVAIGPAASTRVPLWGTAYPGSGRLPHPRAVGYARSSGR